MNDTRNRGAGVTFRTAAGLLLATGLVATALTVPIAATAAPGPLDAPAATLTEIDVPGTTAMSTTAVDLAAAGYTEREFSAAGEANRYAGAVANSLETATVLDGGWDYRTRVMVRTPDPQRFNGTLVVEWTNVTIGVDFEFATAEASEYLLREGYAVAIVSAQRVGVERAKSWSPARYGDLGVDANGCGAGGTSLCAGDPLSYDIFTQITQALKENTGGSDAPMPGLEVQDAIAIGQSQSASRLRIYYNTIQPLYGVFDGFAYWDGSSQLRADQPVPAVSVQSEGIAWPLWTTSEYTRAWDVAGATHASIYGKEYIDAISIRDKSIIGPDGWISFTQWIEPSCVTLPAFTYVDVGLPYSAAIDAVQRWIRTGEPAAPSVRFERDAAGQIVRDANGDVVGGIRLAQYLFPTADQEAINGTAFPCNVSGWHRDYTPSELKAKYRNHGNYVKQVAKVTNALVKDGYVLRADAAAVIRDAAQSAVAK
jgi:hypothetical protein